MNVQLHELIDYAHELGSALEEISEILVGGAELANKTDEMIKHIARLKAKDIGAPELADNLDALIARVRAMRPSPMSTRISPMRTTTCSAAASTKRACRSILPHRVGKYA